MLLSTHVWDLLLALVDAQVQGTTVFSLIRQTLFVFTTSFLYVPCMAGIEPAPLTLLGL
jgi:hypothetical protein